MSFYNRIPADYLVDIKIWWLKEKGYLAGFKVGMISWRDHLVHIKVVTSEYSEDGSEYMKLEYDVKIKDKEQEFNYKIMLTRTYCNFGGYRYWFICKLCSRCVGALYYRDSIFACRHCQYLTYESKLVPGNMKGIGRIISIPEVEEARNKVKRIYYNGKPTKRFIRYLRLRGKFHLAYKGHLSYLTDRFL